MNRPSAFQYPGGDTIQMQNTKNRLIDMGLDVDIALTDDPDPSGYDIAHVFNLQSHDVTNKQISKLKRSGIPIALSTIWWDSSESNKAEENITRIFDTSVSEADLDAKLIAFKKNIPQLSHPNEGTVPLDGAAAKTFHIQMDILNSSDILLPNSQMEMDLLRSTFKLSDKLFAVIPNCIDTAIFENADAKVFMDKYKVKDFILCVSRIEGRKNQLMLIRALRGLKIPLVFIGNAYNGYYFELCKRFMDLPVLHIIHKDQSIIASAMAAAKVHALPSWLETPSLASLEALYSGAAIVTGNRGSEIEYFKDASYYCDPGSTESIREAVMEAFERGPKKSEVNKTFISENYNWGNAARETYEAYCKIYR